jgi:hypothetical protein
MAGPLSGLHRSELEGHRRRSLAALCAVLVAWAPRVARAQDEGARPVIEALTVSPSACLQAPALADQITMWLRRPTLDRRLAVQVVDAPDGVHFVIERDGEVVGKRSLDVERAACQQIHAAVALGVAVALDATVLDDLGVRSSGPPDPSLSTAFPPDPMPPPLPAAFAPAWPRANASPDRPAPPPSPPPERPRDPVLTAAVQGMVLVGVLPRVTLAVAPSAEITIVRGFDLRISGLATGTSDVEIGSGRAEAGLFAGRIDACATRVLLEDVARVRGCAGLVAGAVLASGVDLPDPRTTASPWIAPAVRADARWSFGPVFGLVLGVDGFVPGRKPEFQVVDDQGKVVDVEAFPLAGVGVSVGPSLTF